MMEDFNRGPALLNGERKLDLNELIRRKVTSALFFSMFSLHDACDSKPLLTHIKFKTRNGSLIEILLEIYLVKRFQLMGTPWNTF
jgi:hypothetical protein